MPQVTDKLFILIISGVAGMLLLCGAVFFFFSAHVKRIALQKEELRKKDLEHQAALFTAVVQSQQEEQRKIGREIHDEAASSLSSAKLKLSDTLLMMPQLTAVKESIAIIDKLNAVIRNISHLLCPPELELSGFHEAVDTLCHQFSAQHSISIFLKDETAGFISKKQFQLSLSLYRIIQELITNSIKHAHASSINIYIHNEENIFKIEYSDNGIGFDQNKKATKGLGLNSIYSRLLMHQGSYQLKTASGEGFAFNIYIPHSYILNSTI